MKIRCDPKRLLRLAGILLWLAGAIAHAATDRIVMLEREGQSPLYYLATTSEQTAPKRGALVLLGGDGVIDLAGKGIPQPGDSFLLHSRSVFTEQGFAMAAFDPSGDSGPLSDEDRMSARHAQEVERVLDDFKNRFGLDRIFLIGTSRGTVSAAYLALRLANKIDGVVLAATVFSRSRTGPGLDGFNFGRIPVPLLFIHHRHDACTVTPPAAAEQISTRFPVIFLEGGDEPRGEACGPFSPHGFLGCEREAVMAISAWMRMQSANPARANIP